MSEKKESQYLRILYGANKAELNCIDLAANPQALVYLHSKNDRNFIKPVDFLTPKDIKAIKVCVVETIIKMDNDWQQHSTILPNFIKAIGNDLAILIETLATADLVLTRIWETGDFKFISIDANKFTPNNMVQYEIPGYQYKDLLTDAFWTKERGIKFKVIGQNSKENYINANIFTPPYWKRVVWSILRLRRIFKQISLNPFSIFLIKSGLRIAPTPSLFVVPHKDTAAMLMHPNSIALDDYLDILPENQKEVNKLHDKLLALLEDWFKSGSPGMDAIKIYNNIIGEKIIAFVRKRKELVAAYLKIKNIKATEPLKLLLPSAIGCATDAWVSLAIQERGGIDASCQHGGSHNSYQPYHLFSEARFSFFFTYGDVSPTYKFLEENGKAKIVTCGSPVLKSIVEKLGTPPTEVKRILYIMNLCVPFYSANFPWEFVLKQFEVLELLNSFSKNYIIHVREEQTGTVVRSKYPGLKFIDVSPREVLNQYDLLILESGLSTAVLEGVVTNKFLVVFTGAEWEETTKESLDMLEKRAECFHSMDDFLGGVKKILRDPNVNLDRKKLSSVEFKNAYCNPVSVESYFATIKETMNLNEFD